MMTPPRLVIACQQDPFDTGASSDMAASQLVALCDAVDGRIVSPSCFNAKESSTSKWLATGMDGDGSLQAILRGALAMAEKQTFLLTREAPIARALLAESFEHHVLFAPDASRSLADTKDFTHHRMNGRIERLIASSSVQYLYFIERLGYPPHEVELIPDGVDHVYFSTGKPNRDLSRVVVPWFDGIDFKALANSGIQRDAEVEIVVPMGRSKAVSGFRTIEADMNARRDLFQQVGAVVIASSQHETSVGSGLLLEAMSCGAPILVSRSRGLEHLYIPDNEALDYPIGDSKLLRSQLHRLLSDQNVAATLSRNSRVKVEATLTNRHYACRMARLIQFQAERESPEFYLVPAHVRSHGEVVS